MSSFAPKTFTVPADGVYHVSANGKGHIASLRAGDVVTMSGPECAHCGAPPVAIVNSACRYCGTVRDVQLIPCVSCGHSAREHFNKGLGSDEEDGSMSRQCLARHDPSDDDCQCPGYAPKLEIAGNGEAC